jgi:hypothetical protein
VDYEKSEKVTRWFVEPRNAVTNENAMMALVGLCNATEDKIYRGKVDNKGMMHDVVEVDRPFVALMERNIANHKHLFRVFTQTDGESAMKLWPFSDRKKLHRTKEARRIAQVLERRPTRPKK